jgi:hypothetical protein
MEHFLDRAVTVAVVPQGIPRVGRPGNRVNGGGLTRVWPGRTADPDPTAAAMLTAPVVCAHGETVTAMMWPGTLVNRVISGLVECCWSARCAWSQRGLGVPSANA